MRVLVVVNGAAVPVVKYMLPPGVVVREPGTDLAGQRFDRILVVRAALRPGADYAMRLTIGGELHVFETLPEIVADVLAGEVAHA